MRSSVIFLLGLAVNAIAAPGMVKDSRQVNVCSGAEGTALCCDVNVLGVADLDCAPPATTPKSVSDFVDICADIGKIDMCCTLPILGQGLLCTPP